MADIGQVLATGGTTIVGVAVGAGLTYWLGALNRRHQEEREDKTRWYDVRLKTYTDFAVSVAELEHARKHKAGDDEVEGLRQEAARRYRALRLLASIDVGFKAGALLQWTLSPPPSPPAPVHGGPNETYQSPDDLFDEAVREELGLPNYRSFKVTAKQSAR